MTTSTTENQSVDLTVAPQSAIDFMHAINNQQLPWDLVLYHDGTGPTSLVFGVEQEGTNAGMQVILKSDGTWTSVFAASIKLEG